MKKKENLPPTILFIFGGSGDLANRKLIPALYNLFLDGNLPDANLPDDADGGEAD